MTARFPVSTSADGWARRQPARRLHHDTLVTLCWLPPLALQAASCLAGLAGAAAALLMMTLGNRR